MTTESSNRLPEFLSPAPVVKLVNSFDRPFDNAVATARTCYSAKGIVTSAQVAGDGLDEAVRDEKRAKRDDLARSIYKGGHHTTLQHAHFQFALSNVSRQFVWAFLHSHPYFNSEQVSQRYVTVASDAVAVPPLTGESLSIYRATVEAQMTDYRDLIELLKPAAEAEYRKRFRGADLDPGKTAQAVQKKAQEAARYVLPVGTFAYLYHTVSGLSLLRYWRMCEAFDLPLEQRLVVGGMVQEMLRVEPGYRAILEGPLSHEESLEHKLLGELLPEVEARKAFRAEFDASLDGHTSRLVDWSERAESLLADAVREVMAVPRAALSDEDAIAWVLDPSRDGYLGETLNVRSLSKVTRAMSHVHYVFKRKISHTADSQDQRHRMTPGSRPLVRALSFDEPDYVFPALVEADPKARARYFESMEKAWDGIGRLVKHGVGAEFASYLLPNAVSVRYTQSADLLNLHHKHAMRLCFNAQEEIWKASVDEAEQIKSVHPRIGRWLLSPCGLRSRAKKQPPCPEGDRFCGVPVWKNELSEYRRLI
jgi:thymidylate synthase ThyX